MAKLVFRCHQCGSAIPVGQGEKILRHHDCSNCGADLKCCLNCRFFDSSRNNQCAETAADWVSNKESANFCDFFEPRTVVDLQSGGAPAEDPRKKFDDLFK